MNKEIIDRINKQKPNFRSTSEGWLHTLSLIQLEHHHPISQQYTFAIPEIRTTCICDCGSAAEVCSAESHLYQKCNSTINKV